jgi:tRNA(Arg) A34 adenosine deaminase TadA
MNYRRLLESARGIALAGPGVGGNGRRLFRHGCIIVKNNTIIASGFNSLKTNNTLKKYYPFPFFHAESAALLRAGDRAADCTLVVVRINRAGTLRLSKPCRWCLQLMHYFAIRKCLYSTETGYDIIRL